MNRGQFLKRLVTGVAGLFVAPLVAKEEAIPAVSTDAEMAGGWKYVGEYMVEVIYEFSEETPLEESKLTSKVMLPEPLARGIREGKEWRFDPSSKTWSSLKITKQQLNI